MNVELHHYGLVVFQQALPIDFCDKLVEALGNRDKGYTRVDHNTTDYETGTHYSEKMVYIEESAFLKKELGSHIMAIKAAYFDILSIENKPDISAFNNPIVKHYSAGKADQFLLHFDSRGDSAERSMAMIWYLCDVDDGGETVFPHLNIEIQPKKGNCLVFPPFWNYGHLARKPVSNDKLTLNVFGNV